VRKGFLAAAGLAVLVGCGSTQSTVATRTYRVPSLAMLPTLRLGTHVVVALDPHYIPKVGDIVAFHPPAGASSAGGSPVCGNPNQGGAGGPNAHACDKPTPRESDEIFIKRVVGGPGDHIHIINGHVIRDGVREKDAYIEPCGSGSGCNFPKTIVIPAGDYFVLGDNRGLSDDSRFWGPVRRAWIIGKVQR
jgi:signal peptidase I